MFGNLIRSDGFDLDCLFYKRAKENNDPVSSFQLSLPDFTYEEVETQYNPFFLDPGRKAVFTAANGLTTKQHSIVRCTTKEYYHYTGSTKMCAIERKVKKAQGLEIIESQIPTPKTTDLESYKNHIQYLFEHINKLLNYYDFSKTKNAFFLYQGRKRAGEIMVNMLIGGTAKYNKEKRGKKNKKKKRHKKKKKPQEKEDESSIESEKKPAEKEQDTVQHKKSDKWKPERYHHKPLKIPLIVFGTGMFNKDHVKLKGNRVGVTGLLYRTLKKREAFGDLVVVDIDEYKTSKVCNKCQTESVDIFGGIRGYGVLECKTCFTLWNRDVNASKNMMSISLSVWNGDGRPSVFTRS